MAVNIIWSLTNGGEPITSVLDHGSPANGAESTEQEIFVRHDGDNSITNAGIYIREFSGTYSGDFTPVSDFAELISWGDDSTLAGFGGIFINMNASTAYATGWPTYDSKSPTGGYVHRTGVGDSESNAITIITNTGATADGTIQAGTSPNVRFQTKISVPSNENVVGTRQWETIMRYTYTS